MAVIKRTTIQIGDAGQRKAERFLKKLGYKIIDRNFRSKFGEIDLIAVKEGTLVFIEVKARASDLFGLPEEAVNARKIDHITLAGEYYASLHPELPKSQRIEVVAIRGEDIKLILVD